MTMVAAPLDRLGELLVQFDPRRLGVCPICECTAVWATPEEYGDHALACAMIELGLNRAKEQT